MPSPWLKAAPSLPLTPAVGPCTEGSWLAGAGDEPRKVTATTVRAAPGHAAAAQGFPISSLSVDVSQQLSSPSSPSLLLKTPNPPGAGVAPSVSASCVYQTPAKSSLLGSDGHLAVVLQHEGSSLNGCILQRPHTSQAVWSLPLLKFHSSFRHSVLNPKTQCNS